MTIRVLGVSAHFHDAAAALVEGDAILAAAQEERFTRRKADPRFPEAAIEACLEHLPPGERPDRVAYYEDPAAKARRILDTARRTHPRGARLWPRTVGTLRTLSEVLPRQLLAVAGDPERIAFVPHHRSHAASAFYPSPFGEAAVLVVDGVGEWSTTTIWSGGADGLTPLAEQRFPHSLGLLYSAFTQYLGFKVNSGEYKLMGLAAFGTPRLAGAIRDRMVEIAPDGSITLDMSCFDFAVGPSTVSPAFEEALGQPTRREDAPITPFHMDVAASAQAVLEEAMLRLAREALRRTGQRRLCLAGGVALNCVANGRIAREVTGPDALWIQPAAGDAGGALGAALEVAHVEAGRGGTGRDGTGRDGTGRDGTGRDGTGRAVRCAAGRDAMNGAFLGPAFDDDAVRDALDAANLVHVHEPDLDAFAHGVAAALAAGAIVGHFDGRMEFGPRALGNRSILADPRPDGTLGRVNRSIKFREGWRPFAPMVLADRAAELFEPPQASPYMLLTSHLRPERRGRTTLRDARADGLSTPVELQAAVTSEIGAVTHVDGSARLQTVDPATGGRAARVLKAFDDLTGCPVLLNTSFNVRGEPIVCTPAQAIDCFLNTHMDLLAIGRFLVSRADQPAWVADRIGGTRFAAD